MRIPVFQKISALRAALSKPGIIGLVPTMGALHAGHARLIEVARKEIGRKQSGVVVVSIFVNPIQFDRQEDYEQYGRTLDADAKLCERAGADLIFAPDVAEMYPSPSDTAVMVSGITEHFCGTARPGHFLGVTTVVTKLFHIVQPQLAFFGEKDAQQLAAIRRMVEDLNFPIRIVPVETVREADGLAMSSRNARLSPAQRQQAVRLYRALMEARRLVDSGEFDGTTITKSCLNHLQEPGIRVEYFGFADPATMVPIERIKGPVLAVGAIWIGDTRLIDNVRCVPPAIL